MSKRFLFKNYSAVSFSVALALGCVAATATAQADVVTRGAVTILTTPNTPGAKVDIVNAQPLPLPQPAGADAAARAKSDLIQLLTNAAAGGGSKSGFHAGNTGTGGKATEVDLGTRAPSVSSQDWGTSNYPFTTSQADINGVATNKDYPYRAAGNLSFLINGSSFLCSASLIAPGILVTAAHCVAQWGQKTFHSDWAYSPGYRAGKAPYGVITAAQAFVPTAYYNGTDGCAQAGVICPDDVAVLVLNHKGSTTSPAYIGSKTGWFGWYYGGGFAPGSITEITQLGYPCDLDNCQLMERTDSQGFISASNSNNTIIGSLQTGGSSGGPWVVNLGTPPTLSGGDAFGAFSGYDLVVGVTSWGYTNLAVKQQGAAPFTSSNINALYTAACTAFPKAC